jgi:hypothetical protein
MRCMRSNQDSTPADIQFRKVSSKGLHQQDSPYSAFIISARWRPSDEAKITATTTLAMASWTIFLGILCWITSWGTRKSKKRSLGLVDLVENDSSKNRIRILSWTFYSQSMKHHGHKRVVALKQQRRQRVTKMGLPKALPKVKEAEWGFGGAKSVRNSKRVKTCGTWGP